MLVDAETSLLSSFPGNPVGHSTGESSDQNEVQQTDSTASDRVSLSAEAMALLRKGAGSASASDAEAVQNGASASSDASYADPSVVFGESDSNTAEPAEEADNAGIDLSANDRVRLGQLRLQDAAVRSQQFSRIAVAGSLAGSLNTQFTSGPDGRLYATSGDVDVNTDPGTTPEESLVRANTLRRISSTSASVLTASTVQDDVAIHAAQLELEARSEINEEVMSEIVRSVEFDVEVTRRDAGAAAEAANWTAPPEFSAQYTSDTGTTGITTSETELQGAEVVSAPTEAESSRDEPQRRAQFLALLKGDGPKPGQEFRSLDIVA